MIVIDFETYSDESIEAGSIRYACHPSTDIVCMAYAIDNQPTKLWVPGTQVPRIFQNHEHIIYSHSMFDFYIWNEVAAVDYGFPTMLVEGWMDTVALANRYGFPSKLLDLGTILNLSYQKQARGAALIKKICVPVNGHRPVLGADYTADDYRGLLEYCIADVDATVSLIKALPSDKLSMDEWYLFGLTQHMNNAGLPIDIETAEKIYTYVAGYTEDLVQDLPELTGGAVTKPTQTKRIRDWLETRGYPLPNLQAETVVELMDDDELPKDVAEVLLLRQGLARSSTAKYKKMMEMNYEGRVYNNLQYYGTHTGRWSGRGLQLQNLPRASVKDPIQYIDAFRNFGAVYDPVNIAKALIRPMICAPEGRMLIVSDYAGIENRGLAWIAEDEHTLEGFRLGLDQYKDMAAFLFNVAYDDVTSEQRRVGKAIILGCGYGMGATKFRDTAKKQSRLDLTAGESQNAVDAYRDKYYLVKKLWYGLKNAAVDSIYSPGVVCKYKKISFKTVRDRNDAAYLCMMLPSGRWIYYYQPSIDSAGNVCYMGMNPYTKKWEKIRMTPGTITNNAVQGLSRDIMGQGLLNVDDNMEDIILLGTVHDEAIGEGDDEMDEHTLELFNNNLCSIPWAPDLPLKAEGYIAKRYKKG